jgi:hypothetical protein
MITPSAQDELRCVLHALQNQIAPTLNGTAAESPVATLTHILRHVNRRMEFEGQILFDDIKALRKLLPELRRYLLSLETTAGAIEQAEAIELTLAAEYCDPNTYPSLAIMSAEALALRECLYSGLQLLQTLPAGSRDTEYQQLRESIRRFVGWQIEQERKLIEPAFFGHGPRR